MPDVRVRFQISPLYHGRIMRDLEDNGFPSAGWEGENPAPMAQEMTPDDAATVVRIIAGRTPISVTPI